MLAHRAETRLAPKDHLNLRHPRATFRSFFEGFATWDQGGKAQVLSTMDLTEIDASLRDIDGPLLADYLKRVLDRISFVVYQEIPDDPHTELPLVHFTHPRGQIVIVPVKDDDGTARWKFTATTLASLRDLYDAIEDAPVVDEATQATHYANYFELHERMRRLSPMLLDRTRGLENWQWAGLGFVLVAAPIVSFVMSWLTLRVIRARFTAHGEHLSKNLASKSMWPILMLFMAVLWYLGFSSFGLPERFLRILLTASLVLIALGGTGTAYRFVDMAASYFHTKAAKSQTQFDDILVTLLTTALKIVVVVSGVVFLAEQLSIPYRSLLAGIGIGGLAVAIAARDTLANYFGSAVLLADRPFRKGDMIMVGGQCGYVEFVGIRSTQIRTLDDSIIYIPNNVLVNEKIDNLGRRRARKIQSRIGVTYDTPPEKLKAMVAGIKQLISDLPQSRPQWTMVGVWEFGASSIDLEFVAFVEVASLPEEYKTRDALMTDLVRLAHSIGVEFAFPTRTLYVRDDNPPRADDHLSAAL